MEYLELLIILQHIAVGGTALAGFSYLFLGSDSLSDFLAKEIREWRIRTTLIWITGSFAFGYAIEDLAKNLIDSDKPVVGWIFPLFDNRPTEDKLKGKESGASWSAGDLDAFISRFFIAPFFRSDREERLNTLFKEGGHSGGSQWLEWDSLAERMDSIDPKRENDWAMDHFKENKQVENLRPEVASGNSGQFVSSWHEITDQKDLVKLQSDANELYYAAVNRVNKEEAYASALTRIQDRRSFFRALGFLAGMFFVLYGFWALLHPGSQQEIQTWALTAAEVIFWWTLVHNDWVNVFSVPQDMGIRLIIIAPFLGFFFLFPGCVRASRQERKFACWLERKCPWMAGRLSSGFWSRARDARNLAQIPRQELAQEVKKSNESLTQIAEQLKDANDHATQVAEEIKRSNEQVSQIAEQIKKPNEQVTGELNKENSLIQRDDTVADSKTSMQRPMIRCICRGFLNLFLALRFFLWAVKCRLLLLGKQKEHSKQIAENLSSVVEQVDLQTSVLDDVLRTLLELKRIEEVSTDDLDQLIKKLKGAEKVVGKDQNARSRSLVNVALCSFVVLGLCSIGSHSESLEYDRRVFGFYGALKSGD